MTMPDYSGENLHAVEAIYRPARIPRYRGNPLIEALPPALEPDSVIESLRHLPDFEEAQRGWSNSERTQMLDGLSSFMLPMEQQVAVVLALDRMIRSGYTGRAPKTPDGVRIADRIYQLQQEGKGFAQSQVNHSVQISTSLIGVSGMGKTTTIRRWCASIPKVIYHPSTNIYQVPWLHIELPSDGASIKGLATAIFQALERRIPRSNYVELYTKGRPSEEMMILAAARLMHQHFVGVLICDEVQNLANSPKGAEVLMTQLTSLCNVLELPLLFVGTNKASKVLGLDFRQGRRSVGEGVQPWNRLMPKDKGGNGEWEDFVGTLWRYQWVRKPVELVTAHSSFLHYASQGVVDLAIKLFKCAQMRAMLDKSETLSFELLDSVYQNEFKLLHPMLDALRSNKQRLIDQYDDIRPLDFINHVKQVQAQFEAGKSPVYATKPTDSTYRIRIREALISVGHTPELADEAAGEVVKSGGGVDVATGLVLALEYLKAPKAVRRKPVKGSKNEELLDPTRFDGRELDYRRAYAHAEQDGSSVRAMLGSLGMAPKVEDFLELDV